MQLQDALHPSVVPHALITPQTQPQISSLKGIDNVQFSGKKQSLAITPKEAERMATSLFQSGQVSADFYRIMHEAAGPLAKLSDKALPAKFSKTRDLTPDDIASRIMAGKELPASQKMAYGLVSVDGKKSRVSINEGVSQQLVEALMPQSSSELPEVVRQEIELYGGQVPLLVTVRDTKATLEFLNNDLLPNYKLHANVEMPDGSVQEYKEAMLWPFLKSVLSGEELPDKLKSLTGKMNDLPFYEISCPNAPNLEAYLKEKMSEKTDLKAQLASLELTKLQYSEQLPLSEVVMSLSVGVALGAGGELGVEHFLHGEGMEAFLARYGVLFLVDVGDNVLGESAAVLNDTAAYGMHGIKSLFTEEGRPFLKRALKAGFGGAVLGLALNWAPALAMTQLYLAGDPSSVSNALVTAAAGGVGSTSTSMGIPINYRITYPQLYTLANELYENDLLDMPDEIESIESKYEKEQAVDNYLKSYAQEELMIRTGMWASLLSFAASPLAGLSFLAPLMTKGAISPEQAAVMYMTTSAGCENLYRLAGVFQKMKFTMDKQTEMLAGYLIDQSSSEKPDDSDSRLKTVTEMMQGRLGKPSKAVGKATDGVAWMSRAKWFMMRPFEKFDRGQRFLEFIGAREEVPLSTTVVEYLSEEGGNNAVAANEASDDADPNPAKSLHERPNKLTKQDFRNAARKTNDVIKRHGK